MAVDAALSAIVSVDYSGVECPAMTGRLGGGLYVSVMVVSALGWRVVVSLSVGAVFPEVDGSDRSVGTGEDNTYEPGVVAVGAEEPIVPSD